MTQASLVFGLVAVCGAALVSGCDCQGSQGRAGRVAVDAALDVSRDGGAARDVISASTDGSSTDVANDDVDARGRDDVDETSVDGIAGDTWDGPGPDSEIDAADAVAGAADSDAGDEPDAIPIITMDQLRAAPDLTALAGRPLLDQVTVTYVRPPSDNGNGFYVQDDPIGPGMFFYSAAAPGQVLVSVGDLIRVRVALVDTWFGLKEVTFFDAPEILSSGNDIEEFVQDLSAGASVDESLESELIRIRDATLLWRSGNVAEIGYGPTGTTAQLYSPVMGALGLTPGARFDLDAVGGEYLGEHQVTAYRAADFSNIR